jgi:hypothetical protein
LITGYVFGRFSGHFAFYLTLVPIGLMLVSLYAFKRQIGSAAAVVEEPAAHAA